MKEDKEQRRQERLDEVRSEEERGSKPKDNSDLPVSPYRHLLLTPSTPSRRSCSPFCPSFCSLNMPGFLLPLCALCLDPTPTPVTLIGLIPNKFPDLSEDLRLDPLVYTSFPASPLMKTHNSPYCDYIFNIWLSRPNFCDGESYVCPVLGCIPRAKVLKYLSNIYWRTGFWTEHI